MWHLASLDAPTVAVVWSLAFASAAHVRLPGWGPAALGLIVWALYIGDRLLDARAGMQTPPRHQLRERHYFHWRNRKVLGPMALVASAAAAGMVVMRLPSGARLPDSAVAAATVAYLSGVHSRGKLWRFVERALAPLLSRAVLIGVIFTVGCLLPLAAQMAPEMMARIGRQMALPALFFSALAALNLHAIAKWESADPTQTTRVGRWACFMAAAGVAIGMISGLAEPRSAALVACGVVSAALFVFLDRIRERVTPVELRAAADLVLLTPLAALVLGR